MVMGKESMFVCLCVVIGALVNLVQSAPTLPIAMHQLVVVNQASNGVIRLKGFDGTQTPALTYTVESSPGSGSLFQLSQVFSNYNIDPKAGTMIDGVSNVTGSNNRIYYTRPSPDRTTKEQWDSFTFSVTNKATLAKSLVGTVTLVSPSGYLTSSDFLLSNEGWNVIGNKAAWTPAKFEPYSRGLSLNHYIMGTDDVVHVLYQNGNNNGLTKVSGDVKSDSSLWYFKAPAAYLGNFGISYTGTFTFTVAAFSGDFTALNAPSTPVVVLECAQCVGPVTKGIKLVYRMDTLFTKQQLTMGSSSSTTFTISLTESSGWLIDPQNTLVTSWRKPTQCEFIQVLSALSNVQILGDWTAGIESVGLDNVALIANTKQSNSPDQTGNIIPLCALKRPDASVCTC